MEKLNKKKYLAIIIPTLNEEKSIKRTILEIEDFLENEKQKTKIDIIVVDGGSNDQTQKIVKDLIKKYNNLKLKTVNFRGRGFQLSKTIKDENYKFFIYMDCDLATPLKFIKDTFRQLEAGYDLVFGSRFLKESITKRTRKRKILGDGYRFLVKTLFLLPFQDFQCGFKGFNKERIIKLLDNMIDKKWAWDTEIIIRAHKKNFLIKEIPISWEEKPDSSVKIFRDPPLMLLSLIRIFFQINIKRKF